MRNLEKLASLQNQVKASRLQDNLGKQKIHEDMTEEFETPAKTIRDVLDDVTKTMTKTLKRTTKH